MARKEIAVKKYVVTLSNEEREHLTALIHSGHHPAQKLLKARILLKADASDGGEGWSDSQIAAALESSIDTVARTRDISRPALARETASSRPSGNRRRCGCRGTPRSDAQCQARSADAQTSEHRRAG